MSSPPDPSSNAAQRAPEQDDDPQASRPALFNWLFGAGNAPQDTPSTEMSHSHPTANGQQMPQFGMSNLRRKRLEDVAVPRAEIESVPCDIALDDLVAVFRDTGLTRLPVYDGTLDSPIGMVHLKDLSLKYGFNGTEDAFDLTAMMRPLLYAPPSMPVGVLLTKMQADRTHMALVIDEYGGVDGLVTIEDLIEQVIGEIEDEHDIEEAQLWSKEGDGAYLAHARTPLEDFEADAGIRLDHADDEEVDTLGGLVFLLSGRVPARGEVVPHPSGAEFEVIDADPRRIKRLRVRLPKGTNG